MKKIYSLLLVPISVFSFTQFNVNSEELKSKNVLISLNQNKLKNNLVLRTDSSDDKNVDIFLSGIGDNPQIDKTIQEDLISIKSNQINLKIMMIFRVCPYLSRNKNTNIIGKEIL